MVKICPVCGKEFYTSYKSIVYCSHECYQSNHKVYNREWKRQHKDKQREGTPSPPKSIRREFRCENCGREFEPSFTGEKFCSDECRRSFFNVGAFAMLNKLLEGRRKRISNGGD